MYATITVEPSTGDEHVLIVGRKAAEWLTRYRWPFNFVEVKADATPGSILRDRATMELIRESQNYV